MAFVRFCRSRLKADACMACNLARDASRSNPPPPPVLICRIRSSISSDSGSDMIIRSRTIPRHSLNVDAESQAVAEGRRLKWGVSVLMAHVGHSLYFDGERSM